MLQLTKENITNSISKNMPGIYCIKNKQNNKYYIGQSIDMRGRLLYHINKSKIAKYQHIHRAINKNGLENFEFCILMIVDKQNDVKNTLDFFEKYYIKKFNSYGKCGYNETIGGDIGVLGFKQSEKTKEHLRQINLEKSKNIYNIECWCYNIKFKEFYHLKHLYDFDKLPNLSKYTYIRKCDIMQILNGTYKSDLIYGYIFGKTKKELNTKIKNYCL